MSVSLHERLCARIVRDLGANVGVLNYMPFGIHVISTFRSYAIRSSYTNRAKMDLAHTQDKEPAYNLEFCEFVVSRVADGKPGPSVKILEIGAGRSVNANLLHKLHTGGSFAAAPEFVLLDKYVDAARYLDPGVKAQSVLEDARDAHLTRFGAFDFGITRATLSVMPPKDAKSALLEMEKVCKTIILNEAATTDRISRTRIRADKHMIHPYQQWLAARGRAPQFHDWSDRHETFNGMIVA